MVEQIYEPGTVAWATVRGRSSYKVMRIVTSHGLRWISSSVNDDGQFVHWDHDLTDIRPLVVLDLNEQSLNRVVEVLRGRGLRQIADHIEEQTKPPRIAEPGLWGVVEAAVESSGAPLSVSGYVWQWVHHPKDVWLNAEGDSARWSDLVDPVLVRDGVS